MRNSRFRFLRRSFKVCVWFVFRHSQVIFEDVQNVPPRVHLGEGTSAQTRYRTPRRRTPLQACKFFLLLTDFCTETMLFVRSRAHFWQERSAQARRKTVSMISKFRGCLKEIGFRKEKKGIRRAPPAPPSTPLRHL